MDRQAAGSPAAGVAALSLMKQGVRKVWPRNQTRGRLRGNWVEGEAAVVIRRCAHNNAADRWSWTSFAVSDNFVINL